MTEPSWLPYLAGVVDARGHFEVNNRRGMGSPRIRVTTQRRVLLEWLAKQTGTKVVEDNRGYQKKLCGEHCQDQHVHVVRQSAQWTVDSTRATIVLNAIQPYLIDRVDEARRCLLAGLERFPPVRGDTVTQMRELGWPIPQLATTT